MKGCCWHMLYCLVKKLKYRYRQLLCPLEQYPEICRFLFFSAHCMQHCQLSFLMIQPNFVYNMLPWYRVSQSLPQYTQSCLLIALDRASNQFFLSVCLFEQIGCRMITSTILYRFSQFFMRLKNVVDTYCLWIQTRSSFSILEMCGFRFLHFSGSGDHIFQQISTKFHIQIKIWQCQLCI